MKRAILVAACLLSMAQAVQAAPVSDSHWALLGNQLFPAMLDLGASTAQEAPALQEVLARRRGRFDACQHETACILRAASWSDAEITSVASLAAKRPAAAWRKVSLADDGVAAQLTRELRGLNSIIAVYGQGAAPRYPKIDGPLERWAASCSTIAWPMRCCWARLAKTKLHWRWTPVWRWPWLCWTSMTVAKRWSLNHSKRSSMPTPWPAPGCLIGLNTATRPSWCRAWGRKTWLRL